MISRFGKKGFFVEHYDWVALGVGLLTLAGGAAFYAMTLGDDPDEAAGASVAEVDRMKPKKTGVAALDMTKMLQAVRLTRNPLKSTEIKEDAENFLASERRVLCKCGKAIPGNIQLCPACPFCGAKQEEEQKVVLDSDNDGMPDKWEKRYAAGSPSAVSHPKSKPLNPNDPSDRDLDSDGDGFTNIEEYEASLAESKTGFKYDPLNPNEHPDYLDSLKIILPVKPTNMPFAFRRATKIPAGWRCDFVDPSRKDDNGRKGKVLTAIVGEEIVDKDLDPKKMTKSGFVLKSYTQKSEKRAIPGSELKKTVDVSEVVVERKRDGKSITMTIQEGKSLKLTPVDVQVTLQYQRGEAKNFDVVPGSEIDLNGSKYKVDRIEAVGKGAKVTVEKVLGGEKRVLEALEP